MGSGIKPSGLPSHKICAVDGDAHFSEIRAINNFEMAIIVRIIVIIIRQTIICCYLQFKKVMIVWKGFVLLAFNTYVLIIQ